MLLNLYFHHSFEIQIHDVRGGKKRHPYLDGDPLLSDADHEALVLEKWDAIERVMAADVPEISFGDINQSADFQAPSIPASSSEHIADSRKMVSAPSIIATHWPVAADEVAAAALAKARRQAQEDEALLLVLSEFL